MEWYDCILPMRPQVGLTSIDFDDMEDLAIRKLPLTDAINMVVQGEITDAISVAALLRIAVDQKIS